MAIHASAGTYYPDTCRDVILRDYNDGVETGEGQILECPILLGERFRAGLVLGILHVGSLDVGGGDVWVDLLSRAHQHVAGDEHVLVRYAVSQVGQRQIGFDSSDLPASHTALACRLLMLGGDGSASCGYGCWLTGAKP